MQSPKPRSAVRRLRISGQTAGLNRRPHDFPSTAIRSVAAHGHLHERTPQTIQYQPDFTPQNRQVSPPRINAPCRISPHTRISSKFFPIILSHQETTLHNTHKKIRFLTGEAIFLRLQKLLYTSIFATSTVCSEYRNSRVIGSCCELRMFLRSSQYVLSALDAASRNPGRFFRTRARRPLIRSERHFLIAGIGKIWSYVQGVLFSLSDSYSSGR